MAKDKGGFYIQEDFWKSVEEMPKPQQDKVFGALVRLFFTGEDCPPKGKDPRSSYYALRGRVGCARDNKLRNDADEVSDTGTIEVCETVEESTETNASKNLPKNIGKKIPKNSPKKVDEKLPEKMGENMSKNTGMNFEKPQENGGGDPPETGAHSEREREREIPISCVSIGRNSPNNDTQLPDTTSQVGTPRARLKQQPRPSKFVAEAILIFTEETGRPCLMPSGAVCGYLQRICKAGYTLDDVRMVSRNQNRLWKNRPDMQMHIAPSTLFRPDHFEKYLAAARKDPEVIKNDESAEYAGLF